MLSENISPNAFLNLSDGEGLEGRKFRIVVVEVKAIENLACSRRSDSGAQGKNTERGEKVRREWR